MADRDQILIDGIDRKARRYAREFPVLVDEEIIGYLFLHPDDEEQLREYGDTDAIRELKKHKHSWSYHGLLVMASPLVPHGRMLLTKDRWALRDEETKAKARQFGGGRLH